MTNLVLVTIDSLRADAVGGTGLTPVIDDLAGRGVDYSNAFANGFSTPVSFPSIITGTYPDFYGGDDYMTDSRPFLARELRDSGYRTAGFHSNPHLRAEKNYDTGFEVYNDFGEQSDSLTSLRYLVSQHLDNYSWLYSALRRIYHTLRTVTRDADYTRAPGMNEQALAWLDELEPDDSFFLWVHYMDVHYPFYPPDRFVEEAGHDPPSTQRAVRLNGRMQEAPGELSADDIADLKALYAGDVRFTDHYLGELLSGIESRPFDDETAYVVTSDHGELFGEHDQFGHPPSVHEESLHVPLVMTGPDLPTNEHVDELASLIDLPPTIADYLDIGANERWTGRSLPPVGATPERPIVVGNQDLLACRNDEWMLVRDARVESGDIQWDLIDLSSGEVVEDEVQPEVYESLKDRITGYLDGVESTRESLPGVEEAPEVNQQLEALGYK